MYSLIKSLALPPFVFLFLIIVALVLRPFWPRAMTAVVSLSLLLCYTLSTPYVSSRLIRGIEDHSPIVILGEVLPSEAQAIVILSSSQNLLSNGKSIPDQYSIKRLLVGAALQRQSGLPILITGGTFRSLTPSNASVMRDYLEDNLGQPVQWLETKALNTHENATNTVEILRPEQIEHILLVTHAWHVPRSVREFTRAGLQVTPVWIGKTQLVAPGFHAFLPSMRAMQESYLATHEIFGMLWYALRY